jgi:hypothetical protein
MRELSSKRFFIPKKTAISLDQIKEWLNSVDCGLDDRILTVTLQAIDEKHQQDKTSLQRLEELITDNAVANEGLPVIWVRHGYQFNFTTGEYFWDYKKVHVTADEALFLYRWLVLNDDICRIRMYHLRNMHRRLGKEFLSEMVKLCDTVSCYEFSRVLDQVLGDWIRESVPNAQAMWGAMANITWEDDDGNIARFSFRVAGDMVADIRGDGSDYITWYCCGDDGVVNPVIEKAMTAEGWTWRRE